MKRVFLTIGLAALLGTPAFSQEAPAKPSTEKIGAEKEAAKAGVPAKPLTLNKATTFLGRTVKSADGKPIGKVQDLVFDLERGKVGYAVLALNETVGRMRVVAVPTRALKAADRDLVLNMSDAVLAAAEGLQDGDWPGTDAFAVGGPAQAESGKGSSEFPATDGKR